MSLSYHSEFSLYYWIMNFEMCTIAWIRIDANITWLNMIMSTLYFTQGKQYCIFVDVTKHTTNLYQQSLAACYAIFVLFACCSRHPETCQSTEIQQSQQWLFVTARPNLWYFSEQTRHWMLWNQIPGKTIPNMWTWIWKNYDSDALNATSKCRFVAEALRSVRALEIWTLFSAFVN